MFKGKHKSVIGEVELILHNKRTINIGEPNTVEIRGNLKEGHSFRLQARGLMINAIEGEGMYEVRPGRGKGLTLTISIVSPALKIDTIRNINVDRFVKNKWPKE